ncbi:hypothetical protein DYBT9275_01200 [Dyadobacter sp. CECT 9275]|uniref:Uncharacterized protein n=1 Tax=Dyadobacter helix TaxID=2822344 RepID=A0A916J9E0_9BACT|nr:hypothetical protein DYBT9275_01200 [Dyadobacter sp. CECT 9275]
MSNITFHVELEEYVGTKGLYFTEFTYEFLINFERHLKKKVMC